MSIICRSRRLRALCVDLGGIVSMLLKQHHAAKIASIAAPVKSRFCGSDSGGTLQCRLSRDRTERALLCVLLVGLRNARTGGIAVVDQDPPAEMQRPSGRNFPVALRLARIKGMLAERVQREQPVIARVPIGGMPRIG